MRYGRAQILYNGSNEKTLTVLLFVRLAFVQTSCQFSHRSLLDACVAQRARGAARRQRWRQGGRTTDTAISRLVESIAGIRSIAS